MLPIGISFFTFTQIGVPGRRAPGQGTGIQPGALPAVRQLFPHLIAGPILHHSEMMPQFADRRTYRFDPTNCQHRRSVPLRSGCSRRLCWPTACSRYVGPVFRRRSVLPADAFVEAWMGTLAYTMQLYFDFSGYSDMAIGLSKLFNIDLPLNFNSPYKAGNIIEFWRRWHMTLSRFLRDYLYIPLGGGRRGPLRRYANLMATMLLGGLWHGAGWNFALWGRTARPVPRVQPRLAGFRSGFWGTILSVTPFLGARRASPSPFSPSRWHGSSSARPRSPLPSTSCRGWRDCTGSFSRRVAGRGERGGNTGRSSGVLRRIEARRRGSPCCSRWPGDRPTRSRSSPGSGPASRGAPRRTSRRNPGPCWALCRCSSHSWR